MAALLTPGNSESDKYRFNTAFLTGSDYYRNPNQKTKRSEFHSAFYLPFQFCINSFYFKLRILFPSRRWKQNNHGNFTCCGEFGVNGHAEPQFFMEKRELIVVIRVSPTLPLPAIIMFICHSPMKKLIRRYITIFCWDLQHKNKCVNTIVK